MNSDPWPARSAALPWPHYDCAPCLAHSSSDIGVDMYLTTEHLSELQALEAQVHRRVSPLNQAWAWARAIHAITEPTLLSRPPGACRDLTWLHEEMGWICEDLEEAGAWPIEVPIEVELTSDRFVEVLLPLLQRLEAVSTDERDDRGVLLEVRARARACRIGMLRDAETSLVDLVAA